MLYDTPNPHGGDLYSRPVRIDFSANINPFGTPKAVKEAMLEAMEHLHQYPDPYCRALVDAIAQFESVPREQVLCGNGAAELIFSYCAAVRPKKALIPAPSFSEYETALSAVGCQVEHYPLPEAEDFRLSESFPQWVRTWDGDTILLCNPNNPTGRVIPRPLMTAIAEAAREKGSRLFIDECFLDLTDGGGDLSMKPLLADFPNVFLLKAFTKSYGMAGVRLGYCLSADSALLGCMGSTVQPWNVSIPAQLAGVAALTQQAFLHRAVETIRSQRPVLTGALEAMGLRVIPSAANYILFYSRQELRQPLLEQGIQIRSCANYPGLGQGWYRIAVKLPEENAELIKALEEIIHG